MSGVRDDPGRASTRGRSRSQLAPSRASCPVGIVVHCDRHCGCRDRRNVYARLGDDTPPETRLARERRDVPCRARMGHSPAHGPRSVGPRDGACVHNRLGAGGRRGHLLQLQQAAGSIRLQLRFGDRFAADSHLGDCSLWPPVSGSGMWSESCADRPVTVHFDRANFGNVRKVGSRFTDRVW